MEAGKNEYEVQCTETRHRHPGEQYPGLYEVLWQIAKQIAGLRDDLDRRELLGRR